MCKQYYLIAVLVVFACCPVLAQTTAALQQKIRQIISDKHAVVGVSIIGNNGKDTVSVNGERHYPMQSVFKFHIALAVLSQIDRGKLSFTQKIKIEKKDLLPNLYSVIRDRYPNGTTLSIDTILAYTVSESDNVGCEVLLKLLGGPQQVQAYFGRNHFKDLSIKYNEVTQQANWDLQFQNWTTPKAANEVLASFYYNKTKLLSQKTHAFIWKLMKETTTGRDRLKGELPVNTMVAHKTGSSGANKQGMTAAVNDIGIVFLPNGQHYFISVFVTSSREDTATNEKIIADISKAAWGYFTTVKN
jgi:beta-lactamase class A/beta-lactamase class A VEB